MPTLSSTTQMTLSHATIAHSSYFLIASANSSTARDLPALRRRQFRRYALLTIPVEMLNFLARRLVVMNGEVSNG